MGVRDSTHFRLVSFTCLQNDGSSCLIPGHPIPTVAYTSAMNCNSTILWQTWYSSLGVLCSHMEMLRWNRWRSIHYLGQRCQELFICFMRSTTTLSLALGLGQTPRNIYFVKCNYHDDLHNNVREKMGDTLARACWLGYCRGDVRAMRGLGAVGASASLNMVTKLIRQVHQVSMSYCEGPWKRA